MDGEVVRVVYEVLHSVCWACESRSQVAFERVDTAAGLNACVGEKNDRESYRSLRGHGRAQHGAIRSAC